MLGLCRCIIESGGQLKWLIRVSGLVVGVGLVTTLAPNASAQNLVVNGNFDKSLHGWNLITIPETGHFAWDGFGNPGGSARGDKVMGPGSALHPRMLGQYLSTIVGDEYSIKFQFYHLKPGSMSASFGADSVDVTGSMLSGWESYSFEGKADFSLTLLKFEYDDLDNSIFLDNVSVRAKAKANADVPSPLPLLGLGGAYGYSRRLRTRIQLSKPAKGLRRVG